MNGNGEDGRKPVPVVAIGASAGGLDAIKALIGALPSDSGAAFAVIQHLDPKHKSMLTDLLSRATGLPVEVASDDTRVAPGTIYVIPEDATLRLRKGRLRVEHPAPPRARRTPIDTFISSVATDLGDRGIAVILSGTGSDGTQGVRELKEAGGFVFVQDPDEAAYDAMPRNAIGTGLVDKIAPVGEAPACIAEHLAYLADGPDDAALERDAVRSALVRICQQLKLATGHDFRDYKEPTLLRRVHRRMQVQRIDDIAAYGEFLARDRAEANQLFRELLISVTSFYRDPEAYAALDKAVDAMLDAKTRGEAIRVWVPGCATGEEAYSIAMLLMDKIEQRDLRLNIQIFATDIDEAALAVARRGVYPESIQSYVPERTLNRYFRVAGNEYQISDEVRELCIFSTQSVVKDPPFSRLDLLSCRNLLIYLKPALQDRLIPIFHYALRQNGILVLGPSESITGHERLFDPVDKKWRLFRRRAEDSQADTRFPLGSLAPNAPLESGPQPQMQRREREGVVSHVRKLLIDELGPGFLIVGPERQILYSGGRIRPILEMPLGTPSYELIDVIVPDLKMDVRALWHRVTSDHEPQMREGALVSTHDGHRRIRVSARPVDEDGSGHRSYLFLFEDLGPAATDPVPDPGTEAASNVEALEAELRSTREHLQTTTEELESSNEELKSANEELMSMNEELQSSNEELETSKEELQSINEELETVNSELASKLEELAETNADLENFLKSTEIATLFLDRSARIRRFTPRAQGLFRLMQGDLGRSISDITSRVPDIDIAGEVDRVLGDLAPIERHVKVPSEGLSFIMRVVPYRTTADAIDGAVVTFVEVTGLQDARAEIDTLNAQLRSKVDELEALLDLAPVGIVFADDPECTVIELNDHAKSMVGADVVGPPGRAGSAYRVISDGREIAADALPMQTAWRTGRPVYDFQARYESDESVFEMLMSAVPILDSTGTVRRVIGIISDITDLVSAQEAARQRERRSQYVADIGRRSLAGASPEDLIQEAPARLVEILSADFAKILVRNPGEEMLTLRSQQGFDVPLGTLVGGGHDSQAGYTLQTQEPVIVTDLRTEARFSGPSLLIEAGILSGMSVVIGDVKRPFGVLGVHSRSVREFTPEEVNLLQSVANLLADAIRRDSSDRQKLILLDELRHRVKNMLATVQSITSLSLRDAGLPREISRTIMERVQALALAHDLNFRREDAAVDLRELIETQCAPYDLSRISIEGRSSADLTPGIAIDTSVIIHELITNAVKHGALRDETGEIRIALHTEEGENGRRHVIEWRESTSRKPPETATPGVGTRLIDAITAQDCFHFDRTFGAQGLEASITIQV